MRRNCILFLMALALTALIISCGDEYAGPHPTIPTGKAMSAVSIIDASSFSAPTEVPGKVQPVASIPLGSQVTYLGIAHQENTYQMKADGSYALDAQGNKIAARSVDFIKVRDQSGNVGWMYYVHVILKAKSAVIIKDAEAFAQPSDTALLPAKKPAMLLTNAALDDNGNPVVQNGFQKVALPYNQYYWVKTGDISLSDSDVGLVKRFVAVTSNAQLSSADSAAKLKELADNQEYARSPFIAKIRDEYKKRAAAESVNATIIATPDKK